MVRGVTGVCIVRNQEPTISLAVESLSGICEDFVLIDNDSTDGTLSEIRKSDVEKRVVSRKGNAANILYEEISKVDGYAFRFEGDQIFFEEKTKEVLEYRDREKTVNTTCIMIRNRFDFRNSNYDTNAPHPTVYDASTGFVLRDSLQWPRGDYSASRSVQEPIALNCRVNTPEERLKRWHWDYWRWSDEPVPENFCLEEYPQPYQDYISLEEYVWELRERGRGSSQWEGDSLREIGINYLKWDTEKNCRPYDGKYPVVLKRYLDEHGMCGSIDGLDEISV